MAGSPPFERPDYGLRATDCRRFTSWSLESAVSSRNQDRSDSRRVLRKYVLSSFEGIGRPPASARGQESWFFDKGFRAIRKELPGECRERGLEGL